LPGEPVVWGQEVFVIPYKWSGASDRSAAREVVLYLSQDQGGNWSEVTRARPDVQSFMYRAPRDGEYWFAIRTTDPSGRTWPSGPMQPELRVVVDTMLPTIAIRQATLSADGQLVVEATASDPQLDTTSIGVSCQHPMTGVWTPLQSSVDAAYGGAATVHASVALPPGTRSVSVRVTAKDRAGNPASAGVIATAPGGGYLGVQAHPVSTSMAGSGAAGMGGASFPGDPFTNSTAFAANPSPAANTGWPQGQPTAAGPFAQAGAPSAWQAPSAEVWTPDNAARPSVSMSTGPSHANALASNRGREQFRFASNAPVGQLPPTGLSRPEPPTLVVNSSRFELQYDLQSVGRWGVSKVEVWGTTDGGVTWRAFAQDTDQRSPVDIQTPGDGLYGFTILVQSVGGLDRPSPSSGDKPDVFVEVDRSKPVASLTGVNQPDGYFADHLIFSWQASDANLLERPVSLLYAARPSGPWQPIASNLENSGLENGGRYSWRLQRHLPNPLYVRLEVRDRAGNVGIDQTPTPVAIRLAESTGQIRDARPLE
jgi:hypothetical protein